MAKIESPWKAAASVWHFTEKTVSETAAEGPNFEDIVKVVIATFAVFTGVAIKDYVTSTNLAPYHWFAFIALVALLLRYIIGSAVHLTYTYARKDADPKKEPNSASVLLLAKDFGFVVYFGVVAVQMSKAPNFEQFWFFAKCFLGAGFIWSISDCVIRYAWCLRAGHDREWPKRQFWLVWATLDAAQFGLTNRVPEAFPEHQAIILAVIYAGFLLLDLKAIARIMQVKP